MPLLTSRAGTPIPPPVPTKASPSTPLPPSRKQRRRDIRSWEFSSSGWWLVAGGWTKNLDPSTRVSQAGEGAWVPPSLRMTASNLLFIPADYWLLTTDYRFSDILRCYEGFLHPRLRR